VKLSGDLDVRGLYRNKYNLGAAVETDINRTGTDRSNQQFFMSTVEAQIDADLTDNVSAVVRLVNQRDWNIYTKGTNPGATNLSNAANLTGRAPYTENTAGTLDVAMDVLVDLAYMELKEFLYSPLTLKIGRQDLWFGKGFIVGANQQNPGYAITATEFTAIESFDAIRGTLDYDPWTIDLVYSNVYGNTVQSDDGLDLYGTNVGYIFDSYNAEAEGYYWFKRDRQVAAQNVSKSNDVHTLGLRGSADPIENWTASLEGAYQFGDAVLTPFQLNGRDRSAWALDAGVECRQFADDFAWKPVIGAEYVYYSGDQHAADLDDEVDMANVVRVGNGGGIYVNEGASKPRGSTVGTMTGWDPMFRGKFDSLYREFIGKYYATAPYPIRNDLVQGCADASYTNQHQILLSSVVMPTDSLTCTGKYNIYWLDEFATNRRTKKFIGSEIDLIMQWDYTEDVTFGLLGAWFIPGTLYPDDDNGAVELVGNVKLSF